MSNALPIECVWTGDVFRPTNAYWQRRADKDFARGEILHLVDEPERSSKSHRHFHAAVKSAHGSLPPLVADRFPTPTHLRKYALIRAGYCNSQSMPCGSAGAARRFAAFVRPMDEFAVVTANGSVVEVYTAKSTSYRAMGKAEFQKAKDACLDIIASLIGVAKQELSDNAQVAA